MRNTLVIILLSSLLVSTCRKEGTTPFIPGSTNRSEAQPADSTGKDGERKLICLTDEILARLKSDLASNPGSTPASLHGIVMGSADKALAAADLKYYKSDGKRLLDVSRQAEKQMLSCAYAFRMTGEVKYLQRVKKDLSSVSSFPDWNAPTHYLDVGEMSVGVGIAYNWLYDMLDDGLRAKVENALYNYAILPFMNAYKSGKYTKGYISQDFVNNSSNWNQVCSAGEVIAALALKDKYPQEMKFIVDKCVEGNKKMVLSMYDGGTYPEGYGYWTYGTTYQCILNTAVETIFGDDMGLCPGCLTESSKFFLYMESPIQSSIGYSDGNSNWVAGLPMWYFAAKTGRADILYDEVLKLKAGKYTSDDDVKLIPLFIPYTAGLDISNLKHPVEEVFCQGSIQPILVIKTGWEKTNDARYVGVKGGKADTPHGHMDAGSFIFDAEGVRWVRDYGGGHYADFESAAAKEGRNYWEMGQNSFRWNVGIVNNRTHNTITVNDANYKVSALATFSDIRNSSSGKGGSIDLTEVLNGEVNRAVRTVTLTAEGNLVIKDEITALAGKDANVDWRILSPATVSVGRDKITLTRSGKVMNVKTEISDRSVPVEYKTFNPVKYSYDVDLDKAGYHLCGFSATVKKGTSVTFTTSISK